MAVDQDAFIVVPIQTTMSVLWRAMRVIRNSLAISRVYWHADERFSDGLHFRVEVPSHQVSDPIAARANIQAILIQHGAVIV
ncbi:MAG: hypothetical protein KAX40_07095 [Herpetosiphon sp.]|nr:hypothetical protein [Herpetosiphon sp.]